MNFGFPKNLTDLLLHLRICYGFYNTYLTKRITLSNQRKILFSADRLENRTQKKMCTRQRECEEMIHKISTTVIFLRYPKKKWNASILHMAHSYNFPILNDPFFMHHLIREYQQQQQQKMAPFNRLWFSLAQPCIRAMKWWISCFMNRMRTKNQMHLYVRVRRRSWSIVMFTIIASLSKRTCKFHHCTGKIINWFGDSCLRRIKNDTNSL